ncbi:MAG: TIGR02453 family protein [Thermoplasmata archaeon]|nr:TIGR02453 family protein [Thermoplasmata archaeon]
MTGSRGAQGYLTDESFRFLRELAKNNRREWFLENKIRYESLVRDPSLKFIEDAGPRLMKISPHLVADPRPLGGSLARIYRDVRFARDKSPYKTNVGIHFFHEKNEESDESLPGFYLHVAPGACFVASGIWHPDPKRLVQIRKAIVAKTAAWSRVRRSGIELEGDSLKRPPPGFDPDHQYIADLKRKDFIASVSYRDTQITSPTFLETFVEGCRSLDPLNRFLAEATGIPW